MPNLNFKNYLESNGFYFSKEILENYLLSLKVKPFVILTGSPGTGKTKLPQLFTKYLRSDNLDYYMIKVSTLKRSFTSGGKHDKRVGWGIYSKYLKDVLPIDIINGDYEVEIGGFTTHASFSLVIQLYYDSNNEEFKKYFKKLFQIEQRLKDEDIKANRKHKQQMVDLGVSFESLRNIISENFDSKNEIILNPTLTEDATKGKPKFVPEGIFDHLPLNKKMPCKITINGLFSDAHFEIKLRMRNYGTDDIKEYLKNLKDEDASHFELKIKGLKDKFEDFEFFNHDLLINKRNYELMPVGSDWNDSSHILGYYNAIANKYQYMPAYYLIEHANLDPNPYFLILDEMNSSPMDNYLVDFLSAIESNEEMPLYGNDDTLKITKNFFIVGTTNVNEENYIFSSKILDRANIIELNALPAHEYMSNEFVGCAFEGDVEYLQSPFIGSEVVNYNIHELKEILMDITFKNENLWDILTIEISKFQNALNNSSFEFGFRVINEILRFMVVAWRYEKSPKEWNNWERYFDAQIKQKILPKLNGSEKAIANVMNELFDFCLDEINTNNDSKNFILTKDNCKYYTSAVKLQEMSEVLLNRNYVSFMD